MSELKLLVWMNIPSHHQSGFFEAIRSAGIDLVVYYYETVPQPRLDLGWSAPTQLPPNEYYVTPSLDSLNKCSDWRSRVHITLRSYTNPFVRELVTYLSNEQVPWVGWGERTIPGYKWYATYPLKLWYARMIVKHALGIFAIGNMAQEDFQKWGIPRNKISFLPYTVPGLRTDCQPDELISEFTENFKHKFLYVGSLYKGKGIDLLLKAFKKVTEQSPDACLIMVGNDLSKGYYKKLAVDCGIDKKVIFRGPVASANISSIYKCADVLILPSRSDGWGVVLNEAASLGLPIISSDACGASHHLIEHGGNGFVFKSGNWLHLAQYMKTYIDSPVKINEHGSRSGEIFKLYTPKKNVERLVNGLSKFKHES